MTKPLSAESFAFLNKTQVEFVEDFYRIPYAQVQSSEQAPRIVEFKTGTAPDNFPRNRYGNIIANDGTRVKLKGRTDDYINANYCLNGRVIVAQAPQSDEVVYPRHQEDFFDMLWDENVTAILMLTNYKEAGCSTPKCSQYLGQVTEDGTIIDGTTRSLGKYKTIVHQEASSETEYLRALGFRISKVFIERKDCSCKTVTHYHLPTWEDHKGSTGKAIAAAAKLLLKEAKPLVHCSAGIGRSGTALAAAAVIEKIQNHELSPSMVIERLTSLRKERRGLVQTVEQYIALHEGIKSYVEEDLGISLSDVLKPV